MNIQVWLDEQFLNGFIFNYDFYMIELFVEQFLKKRMWSSNLFVMHHQP
jgi:hypothetical protein